ncbi:hypothetical protein XU18_1541 [Perkinsela sp. CCAP 1560/4]|nr:hypothetical protein XU18_1541 [Perkinsela sp. CCAP 1560/4]|eukprot:KNH07864.1 hypothetical protein XU18_1541 [Perkinsela sp. CCAP 1560/4]
MYQHLIGKSTEGLFLPKILEKELLKLHSSSSSFRTCIQISTHILCLAKEVGGFSRSNEAILSHYLERLSNEDRLMSIFDILFTIKESTPLFSVLGVVVYSKRLKNLRIGSISWRNTRKCTSTVLAKGKSYSYMISQLTYYLCRIISEVSGCICYFWDLRVGSTVFRWHIVTRALSVLITLANRLLPVMSLESTDRILKTSSRKDERAPEIAGTAVDCHPIYHKLPSLPDIVRDMIALTECMVELSPRMQSTAVCRTIMSILRLLGSVLAVYFSGGSVKLNKLL